MRSPLTPLLSLLPATTLALYPNPYLNPTGSITLCADPNCQQNAYSNAWVLGGDFCALLPPRSTRSINSYLITQRPTCDNGSYADWATYSDARCTKEKERVPYNNDDVCESVSGVEAVAFICAGFQAIGGGGGGGAESSMPVFTAPYSDIPMSTVTKHSPSSYLVTTAAQTVLSTSAPALESTTSARVSSSTGATPNNTKTSATLSAPSPSRTGDASSLASCSGFVFLLLPASLLFAGL